MLVDSWVSFKKIIINFDVNYFQDSRGQDVNLGIYKGKVLLVVNVASKWFVFVSFLFFVF